MKKRESKYYSPRLEIYFRRDPTTGALRYTASTSGERAASSAARVALVFFCGPPVVPLPVDLTIDEGGCSCVIAFPNASDCDSEFMVILRRI